MEDISQINLGTIGEYVSYIPRKLTDIIVTFLNEQGLTVSQRFIGLLIAFLTVLLIYLTIKVSKPLIKVALIIISALMIIGVLWPTW